jgi:DNA-binding MarR family transcriptional regulator
VIYARLLDPDPQSLIDLLNPLMAMLVLPYRGHADSARELSRPTPEPGSLSSPRPHLGASLTSTGNALAGIDFRLTVRTHRVLTAVAGHPGASNREISDIADVRDQGQISRLLTRLESLGLLKNDGGRTQGTSNAWRLTPRGREIAGAAGSEDRSEPGGSRGSFRGKATTQITGHVSANAGPSISYKGPADIQPAGRRR